MSLRMVPMDSIIRRRLGAGPGRNNAGVVGYPNDAGSPQSWCKLIQRGYTTRSVTTSLDGTRGAAHPPTLADQIIEITSYVATSSPGGGVGRPPVVRPTEMAIRAEAKWCIGCWRPLDDSAAACSHCSRPFSPTDRGSYYCRRLTYGSCLDLHVVYMSLMLALAIFLPWPLVVGGLVFLVPQSRILTHFFIDLLPHKPDERKRNHAYVIVNEAFVLLLAAFCFAVSSAIRGP